MIATDLQERWESFWRSQDVRGKKAREGYAFVIGRYMRPGSARSLQYLVFCLEAFDRVRSRIDDPLAFELALWYHGICDLHPGWKKDEAAIFASRQVRLLGGSPELAKRVTRLVLAARCVNAPVKRDEKFIAGIRFADSEPEYAAAL